MLIRFFVNRLTFSRSFLSRFHTCKGKKIRTKSHRLTWYTSFWLFNPIIWQKKNQNLTDVSLDTFSLNRLFLGFFLEINLISLYFPRLTHFFLIVCFSHYFFSEKKLNLMAFSALETLLPDRLFPSLIFQKDIWLNRFSFLNTLSSHHLVPSFILLDIKSEPTAFSSAHTLHPLCIHNTIDKRIIWLNWRLLTERISISASLPIYIFK